MTRTAPFVLCLILASAPAFAAEKCSFVSEQRGGLLESTGTGRIFLDGARYRVEFDPREEPRGFDVLVSKDEGEHEHGIDLGHRTWYTLEKRDPKAPSSSLLVLLPVWGGKPEVENVVLEQTEKPEPEVVSERSTRRHEIRLSYDVTIKFPGETVKGKVRVEAVFWIAGDESRALPALLRPDLHTGFEKIDGRLAEAFAKLRGIPMKQEMTISAEAEQTLPQTTRETVTLSGCKPVEVKAAQFEVPKGYSYKKPVVVGPGAPGLE